MKSASLLCVLRKCDDIAYEIQGINMIPLPTTATTTGAMASTISSVREALAALGSLQNLTMEERLARLSELAITVKALRAAAPDEIVTFPLASRGTEVGVAPLLTPTVSSVEFEDDASLPMPVRIRRCAEKLYYNILGSSLLCFTSSSGEPFKHFVPFSVFSDVKDLASALGKTVRTLSRSGALADYARFQQAVALGVDPSVAGEGRLAALFVEMPLPSIPESLGLNDPFTLCEVWLPARTELAKLTKAAASKYEFCNILGVPHVRSCLQVEITGDDAEPAKLNGRMKLEIVKARGDDTVTTAQETLSPGTSERIDAMHALTHACKGPALRMLGPESSKALLWAELRGRVANPGVDCSSPLRALSVVARNTDVKIFSAMFSADNLSFPVKDLVGACFCAYFSKSKNVRAWTSLLDTVATIFDNAYTLRSSSPARISYNLRYLIFTMVWCDKVGIRGVVSQSAIEALLKQDGHTHDDINKMFAFAETVGKKVIRALNQSHEFGSSPMPFFCMLLQCLMFIVPGPCDITSHEAVSLVSKLAAWSNWRREDGELPGPEDEAAGEGGATTLSRKTGDVARATSNWVCRVCGTPHQPHDVRCTHHSPFTTWPENSKLLQDCEPGELYAYLIINRAIHSTPDQATMIEHALQAKGLPLTVNWEPIDVSSDAPVMQPPPTDSEVVSVDADKAMAELLADEAAATEKKRKRKAEAKALQQAQQTAAEMPSSEGTSSTAESSEDEASDSEHKAEKAASPEQHLNSSTIADDDDFMLVAKPGADASKSRQTSKTSTKTREPRGKAKPQQPTPPPPAGVKSSNAAVTHQVPKTRGEVAQPSTAVSETAARREAGGKANEKKPVNPSNKQPKQPSAKATTTTTTSASKDITPSEEEAMIVSSAPQPAITTWSSAAAIDISSSSDRPEWPPVDMPPLPSDFEMFAASLPLPRGSSPSLPQLSSMQPWTVPQSVHMQSPPAAWISVTTPPAATSTMMMMQPEEHSEHSSDLVAHLRSITEALRQRESELADVKRKCAATEAVYQAHVQKLTSELHAAKTEKDVLMSGFQTELLIARAENAQLLERIRRLESVMITSPSAQQLQQQQLHVGPFQTTEDLLMSPLEETGNEEDSFEMLSRLVSTINTDSLR